MKKDEDHDKNMDEDHGTDKDNNNVLKILRTIIRIRIMPRTSTMTRIRTCRGRIKKTDRIRTRTQLMAQKGCPSCDCERRIHFYLKRIKFYSSPRNEV